MRCDAEGDMPGSVKIAKIMPGLIEMKKDGEAMRRLRDEEMRGARFAGSSTVSWSGAGGRRC